MTAGEPAHGPAAGSSRVAVVTGAAGGIGGLHGAVLTVDGGGTA